MPGIEITGGAPIKWEKIEGQEKWQAKVTLGGHTYTLKTRTADEKSRDVMLQACIKDIGNNTENMKEELQKSGKVHAFYKIEEGDSGPRAIFDRIEKAAGKAVKEFKKPDEEESSSAVRPEDLSLKRPKSPKSSPKFTGALRKKEREKAEKMTPEEADNLTLERTNKPKIDQSASEEYMGLEIEEETEEDNQTDIENKIDTEVEAAGPPPERPIDEGPGTTRNADTEESSITEDAPEPPSDAEGPGVTKATSEPMETKRTEPESPPPPPPPPPPRAAPAASPPPTGQPPQFPPRGAESRPPPRGEKFAKGLQEKAKELRHVDKESATAHASKPAPTTQANQPPSVVNALFTRLQQVRRAMENGSSEGEIEPPEPDQTDETKNKDTEISENTNPPGSTGTTATSNLEEDEDWETDSDHVNRDNPNQPGLT